MHDDLAMSPTDSPNAISRAISPDCRSSDSS